RVGWLNEAPGPNGRTSWDWSSWQARIQKLCCTGSVYGQDTEGASGTEWPDKLTPYRLPTPKEALIKPRFVIPADAGIQKNQTHRFWPAPE
ncbi:MAG: hypothetical protein ABFS45_05240, partial [Pseudomonadota bacterium]